MHQAKKWIYMAASSYVLSGRTPKLLVGMQELNPTFVHILITNANVHFFVFGLAVLNGHCT